MSRKIALVGSKLATEGREDAGGLVARIVRLGRQSLAVTLSALLFLQPAIANAQSVSAAGSAPTTNQPSIGAAPNGQNSHKNVCRSRMRDSRRYLF
ncbi:hypothetical protein QD409_14400 [Rhizobium sp. BR 315]|uniref:Uncharacterized protein n=1 Tax=Rhizobium miluonense TaxID=411945 RepID=A0A1C3WVC9_9HYPH|nr:hypothetical protein GA0061102_10427 [Rhizobium miluonense]